MGAKTKPPLRWLFLFQRPFREAATPQFPASMKQPVRDYMDRRTDSDHPPPARDEIRRQMGWDMIPENKRPDQVEKE